MMRIDKKNIYGKNSTLYDIHLQHAVSSSLPSIQSRFPSHNCVFAMHFGAPIDPSRGQRNLLSGQAIAVQFASSDMSEQSL